MINILWHSLSFGFQVTLVLLTTLFLLRCYGDLRRQSFLVTICTGIGWSISFLIVLMLPLDIASTFYKKCLLDNETSGCVEPQGYIESSMMLKMWEFFYWTAQALTWIILPMMQSYFNAGEFTAVGRLKAALFNNAVYYFTYAIIFFFLLSYAISKGIALNYDHLKVIIVSASNTWGLFLLVILLGYGLIEVPRTLWQISNKGQRLQKAYFDVDRLSAEKNDAEETLRETYMEAREVLNVLQNHRGDARKKAQIILKKIPKDITQELSSSSSASNFGAASNIREADIGIVSSDRYLIRLHKRVIDAVQNFLRTQAQWRSTTDLVMYLEDCDQSEITGKLTHSLLANPALGIPERVQLFWHCTVKRKIAQVFSWIFVGLTVLIMWSECTFFIVHPQLSLAARILHAGYQYKCIQILAIVLISYLSLCAYYTVFKLRIYRYYHLDANHSTDENSLLFSATLLCRLTPPICLNFLGMIHLDSHITANSGLGVETQFTALMGHLDVIPLIARGINIYLPILIVLLCLGTWFRFGTRFLHSLGIDQFMTDDAMTTEMTSGGMRLVAMERNRVTRQRNRDERNASFAKRFTDRSSGFSLPRTRVDDDRVPILEDSDANEQISVFPSTSQATENLLSNDLDFSFASEGAFQPSQLTLAGAARASLQQHASTQQHPTSSSFFDDL